MPHIHSGIIFGLTAYLWWFFLHTLVQIVLAPALRNTRIGHALAAYG